MSNAAWPVLIIMVPCPCFRSIRRAVPKSLLLVCDIIIALHDSLGVDTFAVRPLSVLRAGRSIVSDGLPRYGGLGLPAVVCERSMCDQVKLGWYTARCL